jgi:hypothetical protein
VIAALALAARAWAVDPLLEGIPGAEDAVVLREEPRWTIEVGARTVSVDPPRTPGDEDAVRALVASLVSPVAIDDALSESADRALALLEPAAPAPPPPAPPPPPPRRLPFGLFLGPEVVLRPAIAPATGAAVGADRGEQGGFGVRAAFLPARATSWGPSDRLTEIAGDATAWIAYGPVRLRAGLEASWRRWSADGVVVAAHVTPGAVGGIGVPVRTGAWQIEVAAATEVDLASTHIGLHQADAVLSPIATRFEIRLGPAVNRSAPGGQ